MKLILVGACAVLVTSTTGCAIGFGAAAGGALIAAGALAHECYDYTSVTVIDGATGQKTCAAEVTATADGSQQALGSCYSAPLTEGRWTLSAKLPGREAATTTLEVEDEGCQHTVSTVWLIVPAPHATAELAHVAQR
jgi:hypothetical protein